MVGYQGLFLVGSDLFSVAVTGGKHCEVADLLLLPYFGNAIPHLITCTGICVCSTQI